MARKSRKQTVLAKEPVPVVVPKKELLPTAAYVRLSVENGGGREDTIETQIELVEGYIAKHPDLKLAETYVDNGFSGTNFERPEFLRMMEDVRKGKIRCIVVKDLSRFGRNYLEAGYYIETIFPFLNVRLIAVTDNFDSSRKEDTDGLTVPIRNLVNDLYAKDISKKIWSAKQRQKKEGKSRGNCAPYGYLRNAETGRLEIDHRTAHYVQLIFQWTLMGVSISEAARRLDMLGAPTPRMRHHELGYRHDPGIAHWQYATIKTMLQSRAYIGDTETNKTNKAYFDGKKKTLLPREEWVIIEGTHEPIIAADDFWQVQEIMEQKMERYLETRRDDVADIQDHLKELVWCADCGQKMIFDRLPRKAKHRSPYYVCNGDATCRGQRVSAPCLEKLVMDQIGKYIGEVCNAEKLKPSDSPLVAIGQKVGRLKTKVGNLSEKNRKLYEDYVLGVLDADEYSFIKERYTKALEEAKAELAAAEKEQEETRQRMEQVRGRVRRLKEYLGTTAFDESLVRDLVEKIEVSADGSVKLTYRFEDMFEQVTEGEG
ncbi:MAG: recombinase family protein [Clostridiales bacterium]|nr:recombinase family protein [Clostridiales bacterium]